MIRTRKSKKSDYGIIQKSTGEMIGDYFPRKKTHAFYLVFYRELVKENLMFGLVGEMDKDNVIIVDGRLKYSLSKAYNTSERVIQNTFTKMVNAGYALRISRGKYFISPFLFSKSDIAKVEGLRTKYKKVKYELQKIKENKNLQVAKIEGEIEQRMDSLFEQQIQEILNSPIRDNHIIGVPETP